MNKSKDIICWWSGGVASAAACYIAIETYGIDNCRIVFIGTQNEEKDTYRFFTDCEKWYGKKIETITAIGPGKKYETIEDIWYRYESLDVAGGAICSSEAKRQVRIDFQRKNKYRYQVFGFDASEANRAANIKKNYPNCLPIFPLLLFMYSKKECIKIIEKADIKIPHAYTLGFRNNNCLERGCVRGKVGYWNKYKEYSIEKYNKMAAVEHELTDLKGKPVTINKDQSKEALLSGRFNVFLLPHPDYPDHKSLADMKGRPVESLIECNGFCGTQTKLF